MTVWKTRLVAYEPDSDTRLGFLDEALTYSGTLPWLDGGSLALSYSKHAEGGDIIARGLEAGLDVEVEVNWGAGWEKVDGGRYLYLAHQGDQFDRHGMVELTLPSYAWLLKMSQVNALEHLEDSGEFAGRRKFTPGTPGAVMRPLLDEWTARHPGKTVGLQWGFTAELDSFGVAWARSKPALAYDQGQDSGDILNRLASLDGGLCEWTVRGRTLIIANPNTLGADVSTLVRLEQGLEVSTAPYEETLEDAAGWALVHGEGNVVATYVDETVPARAVTWERNVRASGATTEAEALQFAAGDLELRSRVKGQHTQTLLINDRTRWLPLRDYRPGDVVSGSTPAGRRAMRVQQLIFTYSSDGGKYGGSVVLNDRLVPAELRQARTLKALAQNAAISGTGTIIPETDRRQPQAPDAPTLSDERILDAAGIWRSRIGASWLAITHATNGTAMTPVRYELWGQPMTGGAGLWRRLTTAADGALSAAWEPFDTGSTWRFAVKAVGPNSRPSELGAYTQWTFGPDTTPPPQPSTPTASIYLGSVTIGWNGLGSAGESMPADFDRADVHISTTNGFDPADATRREQIRRSGTVSITGLPDGVVHYVRLVAYDLSGNPSPPSGQVTFTPDPLGFESLSEDLQQQITAAEEAASEAQDAALAAAEGLGLVVIAQVSEPEHAPGRLWAPLDGSGRAIGMKLSNGASWIPLAFMAEQLLVPGSAGSVVIADGTITGNKLTLLPTSRELIYNNAFEAEGENWNTAGSVTYATQTSGIPRSGKRAAVLARVGTTNASMVNTRLVPVTPGQVLSWAAVFCANVNNAGGSFVYRLRWRNADGADLGYQELLWETLTDNAWTWKDRRGQITVPGTLGGGTIRYAEVQLFNYRNPAESATYSICVDRVSLVETVDANLVVNGGVLARHMSATEVFTIRNYAGPVDGTHTRMTPDGFTAWGPNPDAGDAIQAFMRLGDGLIFGFDPAKPKAKITGEGHAGFASVSTDALRVAGETLEQILAPLPKGTVAYTHGQDPVTGITTTELPVIELRAVLERDRLYEVGMLATSWRSSVANDVVEVAMRVAYDGASVGVGSPPIMSGKRITCKTANLYEVMPALVGMLSTQGQAAAIREARFLLTAKRYSGTGTIDFWGSPGQPMILELEDVGAYRAPTSTGIRYMSEWIATGQWSHSPNGSQGISQLVVHQDQPDGFYDNYQCNFGANAVLGETTRTLASAMSGASLLKAEVLVSLLGAQQYNPSTGKEYSWKPALRLHPTTNTTSNATLPGTYQTAPAIDAPGSQWVTLPGWTTSHRGLYASIPSTAGRVSYASGQPLRIRLTYTR